MEENGSLEIGRKAYIDKHAVEFASSFEIKKPDIIALVKGGNRHPNQSSKARENEKEKIKWGEINLAHFEFHHR